MTGPSHVRRQPPLAYTLASGAIIASLVLIAYMTWKVSFPPEAIVMRSPMVVRPGAGRTSIWAGGVISVNFDYCKYSRQHATVGMFLRSVSEDPTTIIHIGVMVTSLPLGCHESQMIVRLPDFVPPGNYVLATTREYRPSAFEHKAYLFLSEPFYVSAQPFPVAAPPATRRN